MNPKSKIVSEKFKDQAVLNQSIKVFPMDGKSNMKLNDETTPNDWQTKL